MAFNFLTQELAMDLGTANTVIFQDDKIVLDEPSIVAIDNNTKKCIAIGQKAAYFADTPHFVNIVQGFGLHGLDGAIRMCRLIEEASEEEKDTRDIVPRKGLGCESCLW